MSRRIFLSYRQKDSAGQAGRVTDRLHKDLGEGCSFLDVESIPFGANFAKQLTAEVATCEVLLEMLPGRTAGSQATQPINCLYDRSRAIKEYARVLSVKRLEAAIGRAIGVSLRRPWKKSRTETGFLQP